MTDFIIIEILFIYKFIFKAYVQKEERTHTS